MRNQCRKSSKEKKQMYQKRSEYFQLPEPLEYTRRYMLTEELRKLILSHMQIYDG